MSRELQVGDDAPDFEATAIGGEYGDGQSISLKALRGKPVVLYFYPKDDTPGCTVQACGIRDAWGDLKTRATLFGVSADPAVSHRKFIDKFALPFPLLSDGDKEIANAYGVWVEKSFMGKKHMGIERSTFVIDPAGRIAAIFRKVKPENHVALLQDALATAG
jgi:thioredoxin-dependent peroxiredoxin